jgi:uncharacterized protein (DUF1697 family)
VRSLQTERRKLGNRMARQIALLRGINLASRNRVAMGELRELLTGHGYGDVRTLLQSGNVVLTSDLAPERLARALEEQIAAGLGVEPAVVVRTRDELAAVVERNPLGSVATDPKRYQVSFLSGEPDPGAVREIEAADVSPERFAVSGREIYTWHPDGIQRSPLLKLLSEERLGVRATARNWNTVTKLLALAGEAEPRSRNSRASRFGARASHASAITSLRSSSAIWSRRTRMAA